MKQAIEGRRLNAFSVDPKALVVIGVDTDDGPDHPLWDERIKLPLDDSMVANISAIGVKEPVLVRKTVEGVVQVVDGRRRVLHARRANTELAARGEPLIEVPVMLVKGSDDLMETCAVSLNEIRVQDSLLTKVAKCERMLARNSGNITAAAVAFGVSTQTIRAWQKLSAMPSKLRRAVDKGELSPTQAVKLSSAPSDSLDAAISEAPKPGKKKRVVGGRPLRERIVDAAGARTAIRLSASDVAELVELLEAKSPEAEE